MEEIHEEEDMEEINEEVEKEINDENTEPIVEEQPDPGYIGAFMMSRMAAIKARSENGRQGAEPGYARQDYTFSGGRPCKT